MSTVESTATDNPELDLPSTPKKTSSVDTKKIVSDGLWNNNAVLVQVLGLCPLLAVSGSIVNSLALGLATMFVITTSNIAVSMIRNYTTDTVRLPVFVMIIASFTTCIEFLMNAFTYELYLVLGIFIPLIVTNCAVLGRADAFASKNGVFASALDGLMTGLGFTLVIVALGTIREVLGQATLFDNMHLLFGDIAQNWTIHIVDDYKGFLFAILPPGAFVIMGFLLALKNIVDKKLKERATALADKPVSGSRRVRTTGNIS